MFTKAFKEMDNSKLVECPKTTNPVERVNRSSVPVGGGQKTLKAILENIYQEDRLKAAKHVSATGNVSVSYRNETSSRKRIWRRTSIDDAEGTLHSCSKKVLHQLRQQLHYSTTGKEWRLRDPHSLISHQTSLQLSLTKSWPRTVSFTWLHSTLQWIRAREVLQS